MMHFLPRPTFKRGPSMDALQQRSVPFSTINNSSSCGTPSESGDSHEIKFTHKEGCTPTACACVILAIIFVSLGAAAGVYFGLRFLDLGKRSERVYKGSFVIVGGDKYTSNLADTLSSEFQEKAQFYKAKLDKLFNNSIYKNAYLQSEILALNKRDDKKLVVHFNLHLSPEQAGLSAADLYVILSEEIVRSKTGVFDDLEIDHDSLKIQERKPTTDDAMDRWVPRRQYPGYLEGLTTPPNPEASFLIPRRCTGVEVPFCLQQSYNKTSYPNIAGHTNYSEVEEDLVTFRQVIDFECYPLAQEFICQLLQPECVVDDIVMPCKEFCEDFWKACKKLLPKKVAEKIDCSKFPKFTGRKECHQKPGCASELRVRGMTDRLCDGVVDCRDSSDETDCDYCRPGQFLCGDRQCIDMERRCDEREDCINGVDERNCLTISPSNWSTQEILYSYSKDGFLIFSDSGETSRICSDNLNNSLPAMRRDIILQSLAVSTCSTLNFEVTENVEMRRDNSGRTFEHVQLLDPLASSITFAQVTCYSQNVVYIKCGATACGIRPAHTSRISRIYSRRPPRDRAAAQHGQWPWQVALFKDGQHKCDATLISDEWLLTSTSCFEKNSSSIWTAHIGIIRLASSSPFDQESRITGMVKSPVGGGSITLLKLETPINGSDYVRPACLPTHDYTTSKGILCITLWWSSTKQHLHEMKLNTSLGHNCSGSSNVNYSLQNEVVCAANDNVNPEECQGEEAAGSPLLCNVNEKWFIMGVSSEKVACSSKKPRVFHQTYEHVQWIHHTFDSLRNR